MIDLTILFIFSVIASFVGSTVGGAGVLMLPLLVIMGLPPVVSVGTSHFVGLIGSTISLNEYRKKKLVRLNKIKAFIPFCVVGVAMGSLITISINQELLKALIGVFILLVIAFNIMKEKLGWENLKVKAAPLALLFFPVFMYCGFVGAGGSNMLILLMITFLGMNFLEASATRLIFVVVTTLTASLIFSSVGAIDLIVFGVMTAGGILGNILGPRLAVKKGEAFMKPLFYAVSTVMALMLFI